MGLCQGKLSPLYSSVSAKSHVRCSLEKVASDLEKIQPGYGSIYPDPEWIHPGLESIQPAPPLPLKQTMATLVYRPVGVTQGFGRSGGVSFNIGCYEDAPALDDAGFYELSHKLFPPPEDNHLTQSGLHNMIPSEQPWGVDFSKPQEQLWPPPFDITNDPMELAFRTGSTLCTEDYPTLNLNLYKAQGSPPEATLDDAGYAEHLSFLSIDTDPAFYPTLSEGQQQSESPTTTTKLLLSRESTIFRCNICETKFKTRVMLKYVRPFISLLARGIIVGSSWLGCISSRIKGIRVMKRAAP